MSLAKLSMKSSLMKNFICFIYRIFIIYTIFNRAKDIFDGLYDSERSSGEMGNDFTSGTGGTLCTGQIIINFL